MLIKETLYNISKQMELFDRALTFPGRPREQFVALCIAEDIYFRLHPHHCRALQIIRIASQLTRGVNLRYDSVRRCENHLTTLLMQVIRDGICMGDLQLVHPHGPEELTFILWALAFGTRALMDSTVTSQQLGIYNGSHVSLEVMEMLLDSLAWRPLVSEWNYDVTKERIRNEVFAPEWEMILHRQ
jgi:hypothetical protein